MIGAGGSARAELTYDEALAVLTARGRFGIRLGLARIRALLRELGDPQLGLRGVLVGGTNGKGSVVALVGSVLREAGLRVGETPKPHLVSYRERMQISGRPIDPATFARLVAEVLPLADRVAPRHGPPTEFELLTAMIFRWFAEQRIDVAVVEVGLGGRLDATHAWDGGVAAITNVDLDHMDRLGSTITAIAREKAAIIERGDLAVTGASGEGLKVIRRRAARVGARLREVAAAPIVTIDRDGLEVELPSLGRARVALRGRHQAANVAVADAVLDALAEAGIARADAAARRRGYARVQWPGRLELVEVDGRDVLLDGAHNPAGATALAEALDDLRPFLSGGRDVPQVPVTLVTATMADKDVDGIVRALAAAQAMRGGRVICTQVALSRALDADALAARWRALASDVTVTSMHDPRAALREALSSGATASGPVIVAGSLYLVGDVRARLVDDPLLREPAPEQAP